MTQENNINQEQAPGPAEENLEQKTEGTQNENAENSYIQNHHQSAAYAASLTHSVVNHVHPKHKGIDL